jgi:hypothetical protein
MNEAGQKLLLNGIAYISRFTEDRPIAITPSVFAGPVAYPRAYLDRRLGESGDVSEAGFILSDALMKELAPQKPEQIKAWFSENRPFLHPGPGEKLEIDEDAKALGAPIDRLEFFEKVIAALDKSSAQSERATQLLARYAPTHVAIGSAREWSEWFETNQPYLFFSDQGDYRWYVDPLAKRRGVPSSELRGPARASVPSSSL